MVRYWTCVLTPVRTVHLFKLHKSAKHLLKDGFKVFMTDWVSDLPYTVPTGLKCLSGPQA